MRQKWRKDARAAARKASLPIWIRWALTPFLKELHTIYSRSWQFPWGIQSITAGPRVSFWAKMRMSGIKNRIQIIRNSRIFISKTFKFMPLQTHPDCLRLFIFRIAQIRISIFDPDESGKEIMRKYGNKTRLQLHSAQENKDDSMMTQNVNGSLHKETTLWVKDSSNKNPRVQWVPKEDAPRRGFLYFCHQFD